jgi:glutamate--cysteine ligase
MPNEAKTIEIPANSSGHEAQNTSPRIKKILSDLLIDRKEEIDAWFKEKYSSNRPFFYSSVDVRHSGYKIVPVDTNLFPGGFNILSESQVKTGVQKAREYIEKYHSGAKKVLIIPENHTRNLYYLENVATLRDIISNAGFEVQVANLEIAEDTTLQTIKERPLELKKLSRTENKLHVGDFVADLILVNNDLSSGLPAILENLTQPIIPPVELGWFRRRKTNHFDSYNILTRDFASRFNIDKWFISTIFTRSKNINFREKEGLSKVAEQVDSVLKQIAEKYKQYGITEEPYVFVKADSGTYGMGIMVVKSANEILEINKKERHSMNTIKEGQLNTEVVIQEGVPTIDVVNNAAAEPLIYLIGGDAIGCTYRVNENQDRFGNLNSRGMVFENNPCSEEKAERDCPVQSFIARLATLAAVRECYEQNWDI